MHRHVDDLLLHLSRVTGIGVMQQERAPLACVLAAAVTLLALTGRTMSDNVSALAVGAVQDLNDQNVTRWSWGLFGLLYTQKRITDQHI